MFGGDTHNLVNDDAVMLACGWRSMFDFDPADLIAPYHGSHRDADKLFEAMKQKHSP